MYHSVTFAYGNIGMNTWDDWKLIPASRPLFNPPKKKTNYIDIPGADSALDLSEVLTGFPLYNDREGTLEFIVENPTIPTWEQDGTDLWAKRYSDISSFLNGKKMTARLEDDPTYYYKGTFALDSWKSDKDRSRIVISYKLDPYKYKMTESQLTVGPNSSVQLSGNNYLDMMPVVPKLTTSGGAFNMHFQNYELNIDFNYAMNIPGVYQPSDMIFSNLSGLINRQDCPVTVKITNSGAGTGVFKWRNGRL